jgi:CheY-like chemotaxis protein
VENVYIIIDDCGDNLFVLNHIILSIDETATVHQCESGQDALNVFEELLQDGVNVTHIFTDYHMPHMDGRQTLDNMCAIHKMHNGVSLKHSKIKHSILTADTTFRDKYGCDQRCDACKVEIRYKPISRNIVMEMME